MLLKNQEGNDILRFGEIYSLHSVTHLIHLYYKISTWVSKM